MAESARLSRRRFVGTLVGVATAGPALGPAVARAWGLAPDAWRIQVTPDGEPGSPLIVSGRVLQPDGRTPLEGARLFVYQADHEGYYTRPVSVPRNARLRGTMVTGADGRYEFRTIVPGHYPGQRVQQHIHVHLQTPEVADHWIDSYYFHGDPLLRASDAASSVAAGRFGFVLKPAPGPDGVLRAARDIRLDEGAARRNRLVNGWYARDEEDHHA